MHRVNPTVSLSHSFDALLTFFLLDIHTKVSFLELKPQRVIISEYIKCFLLNNVSAGFKFGIHLGREYLEKRKTSHENVL